MKSNSIHSNNNNNNQNSFSRLKKSKNAAPGNNDLNSIEILEREKQRMEQRLKQLRELIDKEQNKPKLKHEWSSAKESYASLSSYKNRNLVQKAKGYKGLFDAVGKQLKKESSYIDPTSSTLQQQQQWRVPTALSNLHDDSVDLFSADDPNEKSHSSMYSFSSPSMTHSSMNLNSIRRESHRDISSSSLLDGDYDEQQSRQSFQDALMAWRNAGKRNENHDSPLKTIAKEDSSSSMVPSSTTNTFAPKVNHATSTENYEKKVQEVNPSTNKACLTTLPSKSDASSSTNMAIMTSTGSESSISYSITPQNTLDIPIHFKSKGLSFTQKLLLQKLREKQFETPSPSLAS